MRILVLNPNTSSGITDRLMGAARAVASPGTELVALTAPRGTGAAALAGSQLARKLVPFIGGATGLARASRRTPNS